MLERLKEQGLTIVREERKRGTEDTRLQDVLIISYLHQTSPDQSPDGMKPNKHQ